MRTEPAAETGVARPLPFGPLRRDIARDAALLLPLFLGLFVGIWHPIQNPNEGLYARIPQEMLAGGNWIVPTLNGLPYLEKPPLMYWLTAAAYAVFGVHEWSARCAPVLGMGLAIGAIWRYARAAFSRDTALYAGWIFATLPIAIVLGRTLLFDALFTGLLAWALVLLHEHSREPQSRRVVQWSYAFLALAVVTKGLGALVIYAGIALTYALSCGPRRARRQLRSLVEPSALATFLIIAVPWHVAAALQEPGFAWFYFINEHVLRLIGTRVPHDYHTGPWWYYLPRMAAYTLPWILLALARPLRDAEHERERDARMFLWWWLLVPLVVFSLAGEKGEYYTMIAMPALALLLAQHAMALKRSALVLAPLGLIGALLWAQTLAPHMAPLSGAGALHCPAV
jgi:4-amino-4-deoxy-L-arabinose transferase-like glycosyltransferase